MSNPLFTTALFLCILVSSLNYTWSYPANNNLALNSRSKRSTDESPEEIVRILMKLAETVPSYYMIPNEKRGIDLGLSRGFSGSQAAKHLMGLQAANFANGPGRRRRDIESQ
ncbi:diuretic hormone class 2-like [Stegodyphus dumicola]|uniref:diuretic hormone class 2-like n=1 Tax=Stegodyphus dumicola TaxID=202533 RepID=UPI0015B02A76|nr:diuretic hormone class 2-like [Stegodyphus dumicola]